jgi:hypothetical protein
MIGESYMKNSQYAKKMSGWNSHNSRSKASRRNVTVVQTTKRSGKIGYRIVCSPDSEIMVKHIANFDYLPERKSEVLEKYERMTTAAYGRK